MSSFCTRCGTQRVTDVRFCTECGRDHTAAPAAAVARKVSPPLAITAVAGTAGAPASLVLGSMSVLGLLSGFVGVVVLLVLYTQNILEIWLVIILTVVFNVLLWAVGPWFMDYVYRWLYNVRFLTPDELRQRDPALADFLIELSARERMPVPKIGIIEDDNPTAFTYGSTTRNARIVLTKGLWTYLEPHELDAVVAHETGHIVHRDFIVMSIANTLLQVLYEIYYATSRAARRSSNSKSNGPLALIGLVSFLFYWIGSYLVLFLSRLRESYADEYAAKVTGNPNFLAGALMKIAYGIVIKKEDEESPSTRLLQSTKLLGIMGFQSAEQAGTIATMAKMDAARIGQACLYDLLSPWAKLTELASTHPLTGKRLARLDRMARHQGIAPLYDINGLLRSAQVDYYRLWRGFFGGGLIYLMPLPLFVLLTFGYFVATMGLDFSPYVAASIALVTMALALFARAAYKFPRYAEAHPSDVMTLMSDIYASPVRGTPIHLEGDAIGRGQAGYIFSEDIMMRDRTGLMYLDYLSPWGPIGNLFFGWKRAKEYIGKPIAAEGWFVRSTSQRVILRGMRSPERTAKSYARFYSYFWPWSFLIGGLVCLALYAVALQP